MKKPKPPWLDEAQAMRHEGTSVTDIAHRFNVPRGTVYYWLDGRKTRPYNVYFIQAEDGGPVKIGYAKNVWRRLSANQVGNPNELVIRHTIPANDRDEAARIEQELHEKLAPYRLKGEWFNCTEDVAAHMGGTAEPEEDAFDREEQQVTLRARLIDAYKKGYVKGLREGYIKGVNTTKGVDT